MTFQDIPICDLHCDTPFNLMAGKSFESREMHVNISCLEKTNIGLQVFAFYVPPAIPDGHKFSILETMIDNFKRTISHYEDRITICRNHEQVLQARRENKIAAVLSVENGQAIENDLSNLEKLYQQGIRMMTIIHTQSNEWVISSTDDDPDFDGLSPFGEDVIRAMNDLGMIVDVSHAHDRAVEKVLSLTSQPVIASHSCVYNLCPISRNLKDDLIKGIAQTSGLIGVNFYPGFLDDKYNQILLERAGDLFAELKKMEKQAGTDIAEMVRLYDHMGYKVRQAMVEYSVPASRILDHVQYLLDLVGEDFVAFGSDFDGIPDVPQGISGCDGFNIIRQQMAERHFARQTMQKISWDNFLRIFSQVCR